MICAATSIVRRRVKVGMHRHYVRQIFGRYEGLTVNARGVSR